MFESFKAYIELRRARRAYKRAERACLRACKNDSIPALWNALDHVRREFAEDLIDAEVSYLRLVA